MRYSLRLAIVSTILFLPTINLHAQIRPPDQPKDGPGGSRLPHAEVIKHRYDSGGREYWIYEPDKPQPRRAPVIVFLHGWGGTNPAAYGAWLDHLVRRGNIVIYPRYQADLLSLVSEFTGNAIAAIKSALNRLQTEDGHVRPDLDKFAVVGHSMGGLLTANVAALAAKSGLPKVRAMMPVEPGQTNNPLGLFVLELADLGNIPADTLLLSVVGEEDGLVGDYDGKRIFNEATKVSAANKNFVTLMSDEHGEPALTAGHYAPTGADARYDNGERIPTRDSSIPASPIRDRIRERIGNRQRDPNVDAQQPDANGTGGTNRRGIDALDYALWRLFDGLCDTAFFGKNRPYALGNTPQQRFMGKWSDGVPVKELRVTDRP
jgi:pimeloyl-ACP methyl ester carboxylesterase